MASPTRDSNMTAFTCCLSAEAPCLSAGLKFRVQRLVIIKYKGGVGRAPVRMAWIVAIASTAPAAPSRWPIIDFVPLMRTPLPGIAARIARYSARSPACTTSAPAQQMGLFVAVVVDSAGRYIYTHPKKHTLIPNLTPAVQLHA